MITALQIQERDKERVNVFIDGAFAIGISLRTLQQAGLYKGKRVSEMEFAELQKLDQADKAYEAGLRFLEARPRSEREVRDRLRRRGFPDDHIEGAINRLRSLKLIDDESFARFWVENRQNNRPRGAQALRSELRQKGVDTELIAATIDEFTEPEGERERAMALGRAALKRYAGADRAAFTRRMGGYLQRRGFSYEVIKPVLADLWGEISDSQAPADSAGWDEA